jgi:hypothetical protein
MIIFAILVLICIIMLAVSCLFIPCYLRKTRFTSHEQGDHPPNNPKCNVNKLLFTAFAIGVTIAFIIFIKTTLEDVRVPVRGYVVTFTLNIILLLLILLDNEALTFSKRHLSQAAITLQPKWQALTRVFTRNAVHAASQSIGVNPGTTDSNQNVDRLHENRF